MNFRSTTDRSRRSRSLSRFVHSQDSHLNRGSFDLLSEENLPENFELAQNVRLMIFRGAMFRQLLHGKARHGTIRTDERFAQQVRIVNVVPQGR